ncbi:MAG: hypothetical protein ACK43L_06510 [Sphingobacteriales bacterium]
MLDKETKKGTVIRNQMPSKHQELDDQSVSILFGTSLYQIETPQQSPAIKNTTQKISTNQSGIRPKVVVVIRDQLKPESATYEMFIKLLEACKLSIEQINVITPFTFDLTNAVLLEKYTPSHIIMFGVGSSEIGLSVYFPDFQVQMVEGVSYLTSPDLMLVANDKNIKLSLWKSLQKAFSL